MAAGVEIAYQASQTADEFHSNDSFVRGIKGPVGSGKSVMCVMEFFIRACQQKPFNGIRYSRGVVIRNTFPELESTTIKTWQEWFPESICPFNMKPPISCRLRVKDIGDGTGVDMEVYFLAIDRPKDVKKLLSFEATFGWINEAREVSKATLDALTARMGRFPIMKRGGPTWHGIWMDTNPPDDDHWWYTMSEIECPKKYAFFDQPGAMIQRGEDYFPNPAAENIENLPGGYEYYYQQIPGKDLEWIKVYVLGQYGSVFDGKPVWTEYCDAIHCPEKPIEVYEGLPLILGTDFGLTPATAFMQLSPRGQLRILDELTSDGMGINQFVDTMLKPHLATHYPGMTIYSYGDPAGNQRVQTDEDTCIQVMNAKGIPTVAASSNLFLDRREAVAVCLNRLIDGEPGFVINGEKCPIIRKGLNGGYHFERVQVSGEERFKDVPVKNRFSHPCEALGYGALMVGGGNFKATRRSKARKIVPGNSKGWT